MQIGSFVHCKIGVLKISHVIISFCTLPLCPSVPVPQFLSLGYCPSVTVPLSLSIYVSLFPCPFLSDVFVGLSPCPCIRYVPDRYAMHGYMITYYIRTHMCQNS